jgi:hypothetical protein
MSAVSLYEDQGRTWKMYLFGTYYFTTFGLFKIIYPRSLMDAEFHTEDVCECVPVF